MKMNQVNRLYEKLSLQERAGLGFEAVVRQDTDELDAILKTVPRVAYSSLHHEYTTRSIGLELFAADYGVQRWKLVAHAFLAERRGKYASADGFLKMLVSMEVALNQVCQELKLDVNAVRKHAECPRISFDTDTEDSMIVADLVEAYAARFMKQIKFGESGICS